MKRWIAVFLCLAVVIVHVPLCKAETKTYTNGDFKYYLAEDGTIAISGYTGSAETLDIPEELDGHAVASIGDWAFYDCDGLTSIIIPDSVTSIGDSAFSLCPNLSSISIPDSVTSIGDNAFGCCYSLTSITIPAGVTSIGERAFFYCLSLENIQVMADNPVYELVDGVLFDKAQKLLHTYPARKRNAAYTVPEGILAIGMGAFSSCSSLTSITIPNSVTSISGYTFWGCAGLTSITIPDSVTSIGDYTFHDCTDLTSVTIPNIVTSIGISAFSGCTSLTNFAIPASVTSIGDWALSRCKSMTSIQVAADNPVYVKTTKLLHTYPIGKTDTAYTIPEGILAIKKSAFRECTSLKSVILSDSVTSIDSEVFYGCTSLTSLAIPAGVISIDNRAFIGCTGLISIQVAADNPVYEQIDGVLFDKTQKLLHTYPDSKPDTTYAVPDGILAIGNNAFDDCSGLTSVTIPDSVASIGYSAFSRCADDLLLTVGHGSYGEQYVNENEIPYRYSVD